MLAIHSAIETEPDWDFLTEVLGARSSGRTDQPGGHDQGRGPRPRGVQRAARVLEPNGVLVQLRRQRPGLQPRPGHGHRGPVRRAPAGRRHRDRRRHDGLRPPDRVVQGLPGRPLVLHRCRQHAGGVLGPPVSRAPAWGDPLDVRRDRPGLLGLRRHGPRELRADRPERPAEPVRADRLRRPARRPRHPDRPARRRPAPRRGRRTRPTLIAQFPVYMASEDGMYGPAVDNDFAENQWVYLYYSPLEMTNDPGDEIDYPATTPTDNAPNTGASTRASGTRGSATSSCSRFKFVDGATTDASTWPRSRRSSRSPSTAARAATSPVTSSSTRRTTCGSSPATTHRPAAAIRAASRPTTT